MFFLRKIGHHNPFFYEADTFSVLMVKKQNRIALGGISLEFPAGGIESNESPRQAAKRELKKRQEFPFAQIS